MNNSRDNKPKFSKKPPPSPNRVARGFLSECLGKKIDICHNGELLFQGILDKFDDYSILLRDTSSDRGLLIFKGPNLSIRLSIV